MRTSRWAGLLLCLMLVVQEGHGLVSLFQPHHRTRGVGDNGGGMNCVDCTIGVGLLEQLVLIHNTTADKLMDDICNWFPSEMKSICDYLVNTYGADVIAGIEAKDTADVICHKMKMCTDPTCQLFPNPRATQKVPARPSNPETAPSLSGNRIRVVKAGPSSKSASVDPRSGHMETKSGGDDVAESPWDWLKELINRLANNHEPVEDLDHDNFSSLTSSLRGWNWKGKDCNDLDKNIYAGRAQNPTWLEIDWNCNGISGTDPKTNNPYEDVLCAGTGQMGVAVAGDSFGAHFSIPPQYMNASEINNQTYFNPNLLDVIEMEADWPERSGFTGFENATGVMIDSIYKKIRARNLCNHRDYQNVGVNGARSTDMARTILPALARNQTEDFPLLLFYESIGNDVCSGHHTLDTMTPVPVFYNATVEALNYLDTILPNGSHVVLIGLADGRVLWDSLHNRTHPIGVTYEAVYEFLNCVEVSPCWGWMNTNETIRNLTSEHAAMLSSIYNEIIANHTFKNFDMAYYDFPFLAINEVWKAMGGETWQLIEPIDGFHPNQIAHALIADYLYQQLSLDFPHFLGPINPNNQLIESLFGDQGGY